MDDMISRQAAIAMINEDKIDLTNPNVVAVFKAAGDFEKAETQVMTCDRHIKILKDLPPAEPDNDRIWEALSLVYNMDGVPDEAKSIIGDVMLELDEPSAQPEQQTQEVEKSNVEIVRCKDCVYFPEGTDRDDLEFPEEFKCPCECEDYWYSWKPADDWFCANGKRKEDN